jgi:hypothetical protein
LNNMSVITYERRSEVCPHRVVARSW